MRKLCNTDESNIQLNYWTSTAIRAISLNKIELSKKLAMMHPKLRQLQQLQDRRRQQWRRQQPSRTAAAATAMAGMYTDSGKLLLGGLAVVLLSLLLAFAGLRLARIFGLRHPAEAEATIPLPTFNQSLRGADRAARQSDQLSIKQQPLTTAASSAPSSDSHRNSTGPTSEIKKFLGSKGVRTGSAVQVRRPSAMPGTSNKPKYFFDEAVLVRHRRAVTESVLFIHLDYKLDLAYPFCDIDDRCFGYWQKQMQKVVSESVLKQCTFTKNYQYEVPMMINSANPLKRLNSYNDSYLKNEIPRSIYCIVAPWSPVCSCSSYVWSGYPCSYNLSVMRLLLRMLKCDYRDLWVGNRERGKILLFLMSECRTPWHTSYDHKPYYKNPAPLAYITVIAYYGRCKLGYKQYCPDPCKNPQACSKANMLSTCYAIVPPNKNEENKYQKLIDDQFKLFKDIFTRVAYCVCEKGFKYNLETEECEQLPFQCTGGNECLNNGRCEGVAEHVEQFIGRSYNCECPPAWQGLRCEEARDPCLEPENRASCGDFECRRSPTDGINGFVCICSSGYTLTMQYGKPSCRDINECAVSAPCQNGGECRNLKGTFECICSRSVSGALCEIPPPEPYWLTWSPWTACSVSCSVGLQHRSRKCSLEGSCIGSQKDFKNCLGRHMDCTIVSLDDVSAEELAGGAGWRPEEDNILDDAWYFREFQLLRLGLNNRYMAEDEFVSGWEDILNLYIPYIALAGVAQAVALFLLCKRIRVRVRH